MLYLFQLPCELNSEDPLQNLNWYAQNSKYPYLFGRALFEIYFCTKYPWDLYCIYILKSIYECTYCLFCERLLFSLLNRYSRKSSIHKLLKHAIQHQINCHRRSSRKAWLKIAYNSVFFPTSVRHWGNLVMF